MTRNKKTFGRRFAGLAMVLAMLLTMLVPGLSVSADSTIIYGETGSLTIYKYQDSTFLIDDGEYKTQEELDDLVQNALDDDLLTPMEDVVFTYLKVGDIAQSSDVADANDVVIGYSITNESLRDMLNNTGSGSALTTAFVKDGVTYYTTASLQEALSRLTQTQMYNFITENDGTEMDATDGNGYSKAENLAVGLYLVVETGYPATVTVTTDPFFVSIPMTDSTTTGDPGEEETTYTWLYDVVCYPKNSTGTITIDKNVVENGNESDNIDGEIGQKKQFIIRFDLPDTIGNMQTYTVTDTLSEGLTFSAGDDPVVRGLKASGEAEILNINTEYTFTQDVENPQKLTFDFTPSELTESDGYNSEYVMIEITYYAYLNENAVVGQSNENDVRLDYESESGSSGSATTDSPGIYTYAIDLQKQFDGVAAGDFSDVTFELYRANDTEEPSYSNSTKVAVAQSEDQSYWYITGVLVDENNNYTINVNATTGKLLLRGLEAGTYYLVETGTANSYNLLAEPIEIVITSTEGSYTQSPDGTYVRLEEGKTYYMDSERSVQFTLPTGSIAGNYVNFGTNVVYDQDGTLVQMYSPDELNWSATVGGSDVANNNGTFGTINVNNQSGFELPRTGGTGTLWFLVGGGLVVLAALGVIFVVTRKKKDGHKAG